MNPAVIVPPHTRAACPLIYTHVPVMTCTCGVVAYVARQLMRTAFLLWALRSLCACFCIEAHGAQLRFLRRMFCRGFNWGQVHYASTSCLTLGQPRHYTVFRNPISALFFTC